MIAGKALGCQLVNIGGKDIVDGNRKLILGLSWQLMRIQIFQMLAEVSICTITSTHTHPTAT